MKKESEKFPRGDRRDGHQGRVRQGGRAAGMAICAGSDQISPECGRSFRASRCFALAAAPRDAQTPIRAAPSRSWCRYPPARTSILPRIIAEKLPPAGVSRSSSRTARRGAKPRRRAGRAGRPDGYTLLASPHGPLVISQNFYTNSARSRRVHAGLDLRLPAVRAGRESEIPRRQSLKELIDLREGTKISFASPGVGTAPHLTGEML